MATRIILEFDNSNTSAKSIVNMLKSVGFFKVVEEKPLPRITQQAVAETMLGKGKKHKSVNSLMDDLMAD